MFRLPSVNGEKNNTFHEHFQSRKSLFHFLSKEFLLKNFAYAISVCTYSHIHKEKKINCKEAPER